MLFNLTRTITDLVMLVTHLTVEEITDEQRIALIDQFIHLQCCSTSIRFTAALHTRWPCGRCHSHHQVGRARRLPNHLGDSCV